MSLDHTSPGVGARAAERILSAADLLCDFPALGRPFGRGGARLLGVGGTPYMIRYYLAPGRIEVVDVHHGARPWNVEP